MPFSLPGVSLIGTNFRRVRAAVGGDRRMRAAFIAYLIPAVATALLEGCALTASTSPLSIVFGDDGDGGGGASRSSALTNPIFRLLGLLLISYILAEPAQYRYSLQAFVLGAATGLAIAWGADFSASPHTKMFCAYVYIFANFHFSEFFVTGLTNPDSLKPDSFLLNHSTGYWAAAAASWLEFVVEAYLLPSFYSPYTSAVGLALCAVGEVLRKLAMCHASTGFTHQIAVRRQKNHALVTRGVYALCRHPGYLGWLLWSVGTQLIVCNPVCALAYGHVAYQFFDDRILDEERYLVEFFGQRYVAYQRRVPTGIPGIRGFVQPSA